MKRLLTAVPLALLVLYAVMWGPLWFFYIIVALVSVICYSEYAGIAAGYGTGALGPLGYGAGLLLLLLPQGVDGGLVILVAAVLALAFSMRSPDLARSLPQAAAIVFGVVYVFGSLRCGALLRLANPHWLMYALMVSWIGDTAAYYVGRKWGRHKLAPRVSPGKSWEGSAASVALAMGAGFLYLEYFLPQVPWPVALVLSGAVNIGGQCGDLAESSIKRGAGVKDSGTILPGHGGLLDRMDSTLFALPLVYLYLRLT